MAKYVIAIASSVRTKALRQLLGDSSWTAIRCYGPWTLFVHTDAASQYLDHTLSLFKGWYMDHTRERLVFGSPGHDLRPAPESPIEGCYVVMRCMEGVLTLGNDLFCQLPLLHFGDQDTFVASDSMFALSEVRKALGLPCRVNEQVARARTWTRTLGLQNQSDQTLLSDVHYSGVGAWLAIDLSRESLLPQVRRAEARDLFSERHATHAEAIREAAVRVGRHIASFATAGTMVSCSLSGGQDSRAVVAAASLVAPTAGGITVASNERAQRDFPIASSLAQMTGLAVRARPRSGLVQRGSPLSRWLAHSAGLYDVLIDPADRDPAEGFFTMGGHGGELSKGMWRWWRIAWLTYAAPLNSQAALRAQCERGLHAMGLPRNERWSAEWHYLGYRNAIHGGRLSAKYLFNSEPLMQRTLVGLAHSDHCERRPRRHGGRSIITDLTIVLRPDMAAHRYSLSTGFISRNYVLGRLRHLGGPIDKRELTPYEVIGSHRSASIRSSDLFSARAVRVVGISGKGTQDQLDLALAGGRRCPPEVLDIYEPMIRRLHSIRDVGPLAPRDNALAAKLIALHLLD